MIPKAIGAALNTVARACLVVAIAAVGLKTSLLEMRKVGARAIGLLGIEAAFLAALRAGCPGDSLKGKTMHTLQMRPPTRRARRGTSFAPTTSGAPAST